MVVVEEEEGAMMRDPPTLSSRSARFVVCS